MENRLVVTSSGKGENARMGEEDKKIQILGYETNKSWGCNIHHENYSQ